MFKKQPKKKLIIVPKKARQRKISWRRISKEAKVLAKGVLSILGILVFLGLWLLTIYTIWKIERPIDLMDIIDIIWAAVMTLFIVAGIWAIFPRKPRFPKESNKTGQ